MALNFSHPIVSPGDGFDFEMGSTVDLLPLDPFDMNISTTFTTWLENLDLEYGGFGKSLNLVWTNVVRSQPFSTDLTLQPIIPCASFQLGSIIDSANVESCFNREEKVLELALRFLSLRDLLSVKSVCKSLHLTVQTDLSLWMTMNVNYPLNEKITDDVLDQLTSNAQGKLKSLTLVECPRITDDGLKHVLETNLQLTKLSVPGCTRISVEGIVSSMKKLKSEGTLCIKHLRIGGLCGVTEKHFEDLKILLKIHNCKLPNNHKPHFFRGGHNPYPLCDDDLPIDIEHCPKCQRLGLVYDCPVEGCQGQSDNNYSQVCRGCILCIPRCVDCGCCINDSEYEETFFLDRRCLDCSLLLLDDDDSIAPFDGDNDTKKESSG